MHPHQITITVPQGTSVRLELAESDGQFILSYGDPNYCPVGADYRAVRVMADLPDSTGREGVVYEELYGLTPEEQQAEIEHFSAMLNETNAILSEMPMVEVSKTSPLTAPSVSLDQLLARSIAVDPETGTVPTEPAPEALARSTSGQPSAAPATAAPGADSTQGGSDGPQTGTLTVRPLPPDAKPMTDGPPRDGTPLILYYDDLTGRQEQPATWSSAFGQQFWVDDGGETLGPDDGFLGWRPMTEAEKTEYGL